MAAYDQAQLIGAIEPHLKPGETLLRSAPGDAGEAKRFFWGVASGMAFIAVNGALMSAGTPLPPPVLVVGLMLILGFTLSGLFGISRPCAIGQTSERVVVVTLKDAGKRARTAVLFAAPIAELRDIELTVGKFGFKLWIEGDRQCFAVGIWERDAYASFPEMVKSLQARIQESKPAPTAPAGVATNYVNIARLAFVPFGVLSAVALARQGFDLQLNAFFSELINAYDGTMQAVARLVFEPVIKAAFDQLRAWFGVDLKLLPHWKYVFILWWLVFGAIARAVAQAKGQRAAVGYYAWGGTCAFAAGVVAGVSPLTSLGMFLCMSGLFFFMAGIYVFDAWKRWPGLEQFARGFVWVLFSAMIVGALGAIFYHPNGNAFGLQATVTAIGLVALFALWSAVAAVRAETNANAGRVWARISVDPVATASLDVLTVLGGAAVFILLATLMRG